ncbi:NAD(P)-dependent alcohol dehydrogenase [Streptomyces sp. GbtcB7]|uniref:NAD(P)-dependent alcohol dehydrogenase n=1 Tax=Streptomyces sp. GbtcB7 TaxID=2824752 RepID=UPI001C2F8E6A|nr:NAD(P)-dependent alcohol dehydrogenase [Streptomyces sp. GbtcB7]
MKVRAAVLRDGSQPYRIEELELPTPGPDEVLVRMAGVGICHTDGMPRSPEMAGLLPIVPGHEGSGVVEAVGSGVGGIEPGDHVLLSFDSCGRCRRCRAGSPAYCAEFMSRNLTGRKPDGSPGAEDSDGEPVAARWFGQSSFATHAIATSRNVVVVDRELPLELLGPLGCGLQTGAGAVLNSLRVRPGESIAVTGAGAVGLAAVMAAKAVGATTIVAVDLHASRLDLARELGATHTVRGDAHDVAEQIRAATGGAGVDYAFDTTGVPAVIASAIAALTLHGTAGLVGMSSGDLVIPAHVLHTIPTLTWILEGDSVPQVLIPQLIELWQQGRFPFDKLIRTFPFAEISEAEAAAHSGAVVKPVLTFT